MIRINLLPTEKRSEVSYLAREIMVFVLILVVYLAGIGWGYYYLNSQVGGLEKDKSAAEQRYLDLKQSVSLIEQIEAEIQEIQTRMGIVALLRSTQTQPIHILYALIRDFPEGNMQFEQVVMDKKGVMILKGISLDNQVYVDYLEKLTNSEYIVTARTRRTSIREVAGLDLVEFETEVLVPLLDIEAMLEQQALAGGK